MWMWRAVHLLCAAFSPRGSPVCLWLRVSCAFKRRSQRLLTTRQRPSIALALCDRHQGRSQPICDLPRSHPRMAGPRECPSFQLMRDISLHTSRARASLRVSASREHHEEGQENGNDHTQTFERHARSAMIMGPCSARLRPHVAASGMHTASFGSEELVHSAGFGSSPVPTGKRTD